jgi:uncharacterized protein YjbI with pentapeptide repeats
LTVFKEVDGNGKGSLLTFLHAAGLIGTENLAVALTRANLRGADLRGADLEGADLQGTRVTLEQLRSVRSLQGGILPDGTNLLY